MRDIDIQIALALGWIDIIVSDDTGRIRLPLDQWREQNPNAWPIYITGRSPDVPDWPSSVVPHYEDDVEWLEDEVERRGLPMAYMGALLGECPVTGYVAIDNPEDANAWTLMRATSEQRARAFLKALTS